MTLCNLYLKLLMQKKKPTKVWLWFIICFYWNMHNFSQHTVLFMCHHISVHHFTVIVSPLLLYYSTICLLHVMQTRYCEENSVCPSVRPSVCLSVTRVIPDKTEERSVQIFIPYERRRMVGGGRPLLGEILGQPTPIRAKSPIFNQ